MPRSSWKTPFIDQSLLRKLSDTNQKKPTWSRRSAVYPAIVGLKLPIYNGKEMVLRQIKPEMIGHKLGEFVATRKAFKPKQKKKGMAKKKK